MATGVMEVPAAAIPRSLVLARRPAVRSLMRSVLAVREAPLVPVVRLVPQEVAHISTALRWADRRSVPPVVQEALALELGTPPAE